MMNKRQEIFETSANLCEGIKRFIDEPLGIFFTRKGFFSGEGSRNLFWVSWARKEEGNNLLHSFSKR